MALEALISVLGIVLAILGLIYSVTAHPIILERAQQDPSSIFSKITKAFFPQRKDIQVPERVALLEVLYSPFANLNRVKGDPDRWRSGISASLNRDLNSVFILSQQFRIKLRAIGANYIDILISIIIEFNSHRFFIALGSPVEGLKLAIRPGYFVVVDILRDPNDRSCRHIHLISISKIENLISDSGGWEGCRDAYFICKMLPYRYVFDGPPAQWMKKVDAKLTLDQTKHLENSVMRYLASSAGIPELERARFATLSASLSRASDAADQALLLGDYSQVCLHAEAALSYAHKIIFGDSEVSADLIVNGIYYDFIDTIWKRQSLTMAKRAVRPDASLPPSPKRNKTGTGIS